MNLLLLSAALVPWSTSPVSLFTRLYVAISIFSVEMQVATLTDVATLGTLVPFNAGLAALLIVWQSTRRRALSAWDSNVLPVVPWPAVAALGVVVLLLNVLLPIEAADPYHTERITQIQRLGTIAYDPAVDPKVNILGWTYELAVADVLQIPAVGGWLVKLHGLFGLVLYLVALAAAQTYIRQGPSRWPIVALFVVPPLFHQFVLLKNDLFAAAPILVVFAWLIARASSASWKETIWAGWLAGFVVACKLTNLPVAVVMVAGLLVAQRGRDWRPLAGLALGGTLGAVTGGLFFTFQQNLLWYGDILASGPVAEIDNQNSSLGEVALSVGRFAVSLVDMGLVTRTVWPGRGGWGGTFGLPFIWAALVLLAHVRQSREARLALSIAAFHFFAFAAVYPDADITQRLVLGSALLSVLVATHLIERPDAHARWLRAALVPVLVISAVQILRSAMLYLARAGGP